MPDDHRVDEAKGRVKEAAGSLTGDDELKREGTVDRVTADVKEKAAGLIDKARDAVTGDDG